MALQGVITDTPRTCDITSEKGGRTHLPVSAPAWQSSPPGHSTSHSAFMVSPAGLLNLGEAYGAHGDSRSTKPPVSLGLYSNSHRLCLYLAGSLCRWWSQISHVMFFDPWDVSRGSKSLFLLPLLLLCRCQG